MAGTVYGTLQASSNIATGINDVGTRLLNGAFLDQLRPASWRGIPFGVFGGQISFGRKNAVHSYPLRDSVWVEDMGKAARRITIEGFLVGDDVIAQRDRMMQACETPGDGKLVHPTLGELAVSLLDASAEEQWDHGRVFKLRFSFVQGGKRLFPSNTASTGAVVANAANTSDLQALRDFATRAGAALKYGGAAVQMAANTAAAWARQAQTFANDAANMKHLVQDAGNLLSSVGNMSYGRRFLGSPTPSNNGMTQQQIIGAGSAARSAVVSAASGLNSSANALSAGTTNAFCTSAQALCAAINAAAPSPADGLRLLAGLAGFTVATLPASDAIGVGLNTIADASEDMFRRAAVVAMARASSAYQPVSYDDALNVRTLVCGLLDAEIRIAGDQGEDNTFGALSDLRAAVAQDLIARGASLAALVGVTTGSPIPALVLAYRLYGDISRADELIGFANPINPAFMPVSMRVLNS